MGTVISGAASPHTAHVAKPAAPANLDADLAKCQSQLSDWVHCVSAKTPEGKAKIEAISTQIDAIKEKMRQAEEVKAQDPASQTTRAPEVNPTDAASNDPTRAARGLDLTGRGAYIDAYA